MEKEYINKENKDDDDNYLSIFNTNNKEITEKDVISLLKKYNLPTTIFNMTIFKRCFVHSSYTIKEGMTIPKIIPGVMPLKHKSNERLEFLGDGILESVTKFYLYKRFPTKDEGFMTETKIALVKNESIGKLVQKIGLQKWFIISKEAEEKGLRNNIKKLGCLFEAFIGALFLNFNKITVDDEDINIFNSKNNLSVMSGYTICTQFIESVFEEYVNWNDILNENNNYKNLFQVIIQREFKITPDFVLLNGVYDEQTGVNKPQQDYHSCVFVCCGSYSIHNTNIDKAVNYETLENGFDTMREMLNNEGGFIIRFGDSKHSTKKKAEQEACRLSIEMINKYK